MIWGSTARSVLRHKYGFIRKRGGRRKECSGVNWPGETRRSQGSTARGVQRPEEGRMPGGQEEEAATPSPPFCSRRPLGYSRVGTGMVQRVWFATSHRTCHGASNGHAGRCRTAPLPVRKYWWQTACVSASGCRTCNNLLAILQKYSPCWP